MSQDEFYRLIGPAYLFNFYENFHVCVDCCNKNTRQKQLEGFMLTRIFSLWLLAHVEYYDSGHMYWGDSSLGR